MKSGLTSTIKAIVELKPSEKIEMLRLMKSYYAGIEKHQFEVDLASKTDITLVHSSSGKLVGFSTLSHWPDMYGGQGIHVMFSGDTIVNHLYRGSPVFATSWLQLAARIKNRAPKLSLYWFLIVKGHRTYRFLDVFAKDYYPAWRRDIVDNKADMLNMLAASKFGDCYNPLTGLIRFPQPSSRLLPEWAEVPQKDIARPEVKFFLDRNPHFRLGDELACLVEVSADNMKPFARRIFEAALRQ